MIKNYLGGLMYRKFLITIILALLIFSPAYSIEKFYTYYDKGIQFMEKGEWERAIEELKSAIFI
jgi:hypothetical protein